MNKRCEYCEIAGGYGELMEETSYWLIYLAPSQRYLGTCVVALKRRAANLSELSDSQWADFIDILRRLENSVNKAFQPTLFNWSCFKNMAFRESNPNPEIHWHFLPRYREKVKFSDMIFEDPDFGYLPKPIKHEIPPEVMINIKSAIKKYL